MTVNDLIQLLVDHVQAGRCTPDSEVITHEGRDIAIEIGMTHTVYIVAVPVQWTIKGE